MKHSYLTLSVVHFSHFPNFPKTQKHKVSVTLNHITSFSLNIVANILDNVCTQLKEVTSYVLIFVINIKYHTKYAGEASLNPYKTLVRFAKNCSAQLY